MIFKLHIDKNCDEEVNAKVHERTPLIDEIERLVLMENITDKIPSYLDLHIDLCHHICRNLVQHLHFHMDKSK